MYDFLIEIATVIITFEYLKIKFFSYVDCPFFLLLNPSIVYSNRILLIHLSCLGQPHFSFIYKMINYISQIILFYHFHLDWFDSFTVSYLNAICLRRRFSMHEFVVQKISCFHLAFHYACLCFESREPFLQYLLQFLLKFMMPSITFLHLYFN